MDTNPHAWSLLSSTLPLTTAIANLLVFINAHLAINNTNRVTVIASHTGCSQFLYPTPSLAAERSHTNGHGPGHQNGNTEQDVDMEDAPTQPAGAASTGDANKYRPFATVEHAITTNLRNLLDSTTPDDLSESTSTMLAGALTLALSYINKQTLTASNTGNVSSAGDTNTVGQFSAQTNDGITTAATTSLLSRILVVSVSGDLATQYIPIMNAIFACQRLAVPIDILELSPYSAPEFLQQAADATGGIYMDLGGKAGTTSSTSDTNTTTNPSPTTKIPGLLQTLMMAYLPDQSARHFLTPAGESEGVDFRAACFCHGRVVDLGWVCSICLSIFCEPLADNTCLTCGTWLSLANYGTKPVVVPSRKKVKKKRLGGIGGAGASGAETPRSEGGETPGR